MKCVQRNCLVEFKDIKHIAALLNKMLKKPKQKMTYIISVFKVNTMFNPILALFAHSFQKVNDVKIIPKNHSFKQRKSQKIFQTIKMNPLIFKTVFPFLSTGSKGLSFKAITKVSQFIQALTLTYRRHNPRQCIVSLFQSKST